MSWTYDASNLSTSSNAGRRNIVRLIVQDVDTADQLLQNEEIDYFLTSNNDSVRRASIQAVRALIAKFARAVDEKMGHTLVERGQLLRNYRQLLDDLIHDSDSQVVTIYAGGISKAEETAQDLDTDLPDRPFGIGMDSILSDYNTEDDLD